MLIPQGIFVGWGKELKKFIGLILMVIFIGFCVVMLARPAYPGDPIDFVAFGVM